MSSSNYQAKITSTPSRLPLRAFMLADDFTRSINTSRPVPIFTSNQFTSVFPARAPQIELFAKPCSNSEVVRITIGADVYEYKLEHICPTYRIVRVMGEYRQFKHLPSYILVYTEKDAVAGLNDYVLGHYTQMQRHCNIY